MPTVTGPLQRAGVVLLDYSTAPNFRQENSVIYISNDWDELVTLLTDSKLFLESLRITFRDKAGTSLATPTRWTIKEPHTIVLAPLLDEPSQTVRTISIVRPDLRDRLEEAMKAEHGAFNYAELYETLDNFLDDIFGGPGFIVEYAIDTAVAWIRYRRPKQKSPVRHTGTLTPATIGNILADIGTSAHSRTGAACLHFDIGMLPEERAKFAVDYIEDPAFAATRIASNLSVAECIAAGPGAKLERSVPTKVLKAPTFLSDPLDRFGPSVIMEVAPMEAPPCCVCVGATLREAEWNQTTGEVTKYYMSCALLKIYCNKTC